VVSFFLCPIKACKVARLMFLSALWAPKVCRSVCTLTRFRIPAFLTYLATIALTEETLSEGARERGAVLGEKEGLVVEDELACAVAKIISESLDLFIDQGDLPILPSLPGI
jgi:hypothetical protein